MAVGEWAPQQTVVIGRPFWVHFGTQFSRRISESAARKIAGGFGPLLAQHHSNLLLFPPPYLIEGGAGPQVSIRRSNPLFCFLIKGYGVRLSLVSFYYSPGNFGANPWGGGFALPSRHVLTSGGPPWLWAVPRGSRDPIRGNSTKNNRVTKTRPTCQKLTGV